MGVRVDIALKTIRLLLCMTYIQLLKQIKERIRGAQYDALRAVNKELINLYWDIGKMIVTKQNLEGWGGSIVEQLSADIQKEFPGIKGYSARNLWNIRTFYVTNSKNPKLQPLVAEISWTKNVIIMEKCKNDAEKEFYINMTKKFGWTKNVLVHQIEGKTYEKFLLNQTNFDKTVPEKYKNQAKLAVKDEYIFDFLELGELHSEKDLESALIANVKKFLLELGGYFTFIGNSYKIEAGNEDFFIDLLLFHRKLRCFVAIELKIGEFKPEHAGKMQFYLAVLNDKLKLDNENPAIGIILCKSKNRIIAEYALQDTRQPMGVSTYKLTTNLPKVLRKYLPTSKELNGCLGG